MLTRSVVLCVLLGLTGLFVAPRQAEAQVWTSIAGCSQSSAGATSTLTCAASLTVTAGDLLFACAGTATTTSVDITFVENGGGAGMTEHGQLSNTNLRQRSGYIVSGGGTLTPVADFATSVTNSYLSVRQYRATGTINHLVDGGNTGSSQTPTSDSITQSGSSNLAWLNCGRSSGGGAWDTFTVDGAAAESSATIGTGHRWHTLNLSSLSSDTATANITGGTNTWAVSSAVFESVSSAGGLACAQLLTTGVGGECEE